MELSKLSAIFKALSNEQRLRIFKMIYDWNRAGSEDICGPDCCTETDKAFTMLCDCIELSRSTISHHLRELQHAQLIETNRKGQMFSSKVNLETLQAIKDFVE
ncbi:MAG: transcriptional regulator [Spirochaetales bacterium]|nr:transcriptional regulator [Spirochaetales bacterium]